MAEVSAPFTPSPIVRSRLGRSLRASVEDVWRSPAAPNPPNWAKSDFLIVPFVAMELLLGFYVDEVGYEDPPTYLFEALGVIALAAFLLRRFFPLTSTVMIFGLYGVAGGMVMAGQMAGRPAPVMMIILVYSLTRWADGRRMIAGLTVAAAAGPFAVALDQDPDGEFLIGFMALTAALGLAFRVSVRRAEHETRTLERQRMALELHDSLAHHLSGVAIQARAAKIKLPSGSDATAHLDTIAESASAALDDVRGVVRVLRSDDPETTPRMPYDLNSVHTLATDGTVAGTAVAVEMKGTLGDLGQPVETGLYRIAQEATTNAFRHARNAGLIRIKVVGKADEVVLTVIDDGDEVSPGQGGGFGLTGMAERASLLGGRLDAGPKQPNGWMVRAVLPKPAAGRT